MKPHIPRHLLDRSAQWTELHQWERKQLGIELRRLGLSLGEIRELIPVPKSTLHTWFNGMQLTPGQAEAIRARAGPGSRRGVPVDTQWKRREEIERIRSEARDFAVAHLDDSAFVAGVVLYWGEGAKSRNFVDLSNGDPGALRLFITWCRTYLDPRVEIQLSLHLHAGNDEAEAKSFWRKELGLTDVSFGQSHIKGDGTGHRKNHLPHGICRVRTRRASDNWHRVMTWIDVVSETFGVIGSPDC